METLFHYLQQFHALSPALQSRLSSYLQEVHFEKGTYVLNYGDCCRHLYFVQKGFARGVKEVNDKVVTTWFWKEMDLIASMQSFIQQEPTLEAIQALEDCHMFQLGYDDLQALYEEFVEFNIVGRKIIEQYFLQTAEIMYALRNLTALERYENLLAAHPDIFQRTTLLNISSYLGLSQETISRIRKQR